MRIPPAPRSDTSRRAPPSTNGTTRTSHRNSGGSSRPTFCRASMSACPAAARLDRGRYLALYPARKHPDSRSMYFAREGKRYRSLGCMADYQSRSRATPIPSIRSSTELENDARFRTRRTGARSPRAQCDAEASGEGVYVSARESDNFTRRAEAEIRRCWACRSREIDADRAHLLRHRSTLPEGKSRTDPEGMRG